MSANVRCIEYYHPCTQHTVDGCLLKTNTHLEELAPPKVKFFTWLATREQIWTAVIADVGMVLTPTTPAGCVIKSWKRATIYTCELLVCQTNLVGDSDVDGLHMLLPLGSAEAAGLVAGGHMPGAYKPNNKGTGALPA